MSTTKTKNEILIAIKCCNANWAENTTKYCDNCPYQTLGDGCFMEKDADVERFLYERIELVTALASEVKSVTKTLDGYIAAYEAIISLLSALYNSAKAETEEDGVSLTEKEILALAEYIEKIKRGEIVCEG